MEMARLERRAPALAATADIVTVAGIGSDSCTDGNVEGRSERRSRGGQIGQVPADPDHEAISLAWSADPSGGRLVNRCDRCDFSLFPELENRHCSAALRALRIMALSIERCANEVLGVFTGAVPSADCVKFAVSKGLVRPAPSPRAIN